MFTGPVKRVEATRIFARKTEVTRQLLVYEMKVAAPTSVAMVLPIPITPGSGEGAVRFISLEDAADFFDVLDWMFLPPARPGASRGGPDLQTERLAVHEVGAFNASFVPRLADFERLDPQFRMPRGTLDAVPDYADYGFVVFQLAPTRSLSQVHPMAFEFATRESTRVFFPTMHCHNRTIPEDANFAHMLYGQDIDELDAWQPAKRAPSPQFWPPVMAEWVHPSAPFTRRRIFGRRANTDTWAQVRGSIAG